LRTLADLNRLGALPVAGGATRRAASSGKRAGKSLPRNQIKKSELHKQFVFFNLILEEE